MAGKKKDEPVEETVHEEIEGQVVAFEGTVGAASDVTIDGAPPEVEEVVVDGESIEVEVVPDPPEPEPEPEDDVPEEPGEVKEEPTEAQAPDAPSGVISPYDDEGPEFADKAPTDEEG